ncbi:hypothetical protein K4F52_004901 [Lecanicillium sp. MT-2017a]|nr:hypothetical protein K4F52_004901 [Lecanicillium sp. MT-2017a]
MAASRFESQMYTADKYVESAGTVLFRLSTRQICILRIRQSNEYVLPKGRCNLGESRQATAIRETIEETGIPCSLLPIDLLSRACPTMETTPAPDEARLYRGVCEPIAMQSRRIGSGEMKLIWWFVAAVKEGQPILEHEPETFEVEFHSYEEAITRLTFKDSRELVTTAIEVLNSTHRELYKDRTKDLA